MNRAKYVPFFEPLLNEFEKEFELQYKTLLCLKSEIVNMQNKFEKCLEENENLKNNNLKLQSRVDQLIIENNAKSSSAIWEKMQSIGTEKDIIIEDLKKKLEWEKRSKLVRVTEPEIVKPTVVPKAELLTVDNPRIIKSMEPSSTTEPIKSMEPSSTTEPLKSMEPSSTTSDPLKSMEPSSTTEPLKSMEPSSTTIEPLKKKKEKKHRSKEKNLDTTVTTPTIDTVTKPVIKLKKDKKDKI